MANKFTQNRLFKYLFESKGEFQKISWPSQKETIRYSIIVIAFSVTLAIYFGILDWVLNKGIIWLIGLTA